MIYGKITYSFRPDGSVSFDASKAKADGGEAEIRAHLEGIARDLGAVWTLERHVATVRFEVGAKRGLGVLAPVTHHDHHKIGN